MAQWVKLLAAKPNDLFDSQGSYDLHKITTPPPPPPHTCK